MNARHTTAGVQSSQLNQRLSHDRRRGASVCLIFNVSRLEGSVHVRLAIAVLIITALSTGCSSKTQSASSNAGPLPKGIDTAGMDTSVAAGDDFYAYTNGGWVKSTEIPPDKSSYG